eukprot:gene21389-biopygen20658
MTKLHQFGRARGMLGKERCLPIPLPGHRPAAKRLGRRFVTQAALPRGALGWGCPPPALHVLHTCSPGSCLSTSTFCSYAGTPCPGCGCRRVGCAWRSGSTPLQPTLDVREVLAHHCGLPRTATHRAPPHAAKHPDAQDSMGTQRSAAQHSTALQNTSQSSAAQHRGHRTVNGLTARDAGRHKRQTQIPPAEKGELMTYATCVRRIVRSIKVGALCKYGEVDRHRRWVGLLLTVCGSVRRQECCCKTTSNIRNTAVRVTSWFHEAGVINMTKKATQQIVAASILIQSPGLHWVHRMVRRYRGKKKKTLGAGLAGDPRHDAVLRRPPARGASRRRRRGQSLPARTRC